MISIGPTEAPTSHDAKKQECYDHRENYGTKLIPHRHFLRATDTPLHRRSAWRRAVGSVLHEACTPCLFPEYASFPTHSWHSSRVFYLAGHPTYRGRLARNGRYHAPMMTHNTKAAKNQRLRKLIKAQIYDKLPGSGFTRFFNCSSRIKRVYLSRGCGHRRYIMFMLCSSDTDLTDAQWAARFDRIFRRRTGFVTLDRLLKRLHTNKPELLMVLDRPEIPLHTNGSERDIRAFMSPNARSVAKTHAHSLDSPGACRDAFLGLRRTAAKLTGPSAHTLC